MVSGATIIELSGINPVRFTVAEATTIEKGAVLQVSDPRTAVANSANGDPIAGIAAAEKVGGDASTTLAVHVPGSNNIFDMVCSGNVAVGMKVHATATANQIAGVLSQAASVEYSGGVLGRSLETGTAGETIAVLV
jgi:hypothetical protein